MPDPRDVYGRSFRVVAHAGDRICIGMFPRTADGESKPWRQLYCFRVSEAVELARQLTDAVDVNRRGRDQT